MTRPRVALLNAAHDGHNTSRNFRRELDAELVEYDATGGDLPDGFEFDGCVVSGSRSSVYWDEEWIAATKEWTRAALEEGLPVLGVCWGHQLLADVLGGEVEDMGAFEIGYRTVEHDGGPLFEGIDEEFLVYTTHGDRVAELPPGAERTAENDYGVHGFRKGDAFGVQFHPEYDARTAREVTEGKDLDPGRKERVLDRITDENERRAQEAKTVFANFVQYVRERAGDPAAERTPADD